MNGQRRHHRLSLVAHFLLAAGLVAPAMLPRHLLAQEASPAALAATPEAGRPWWQDTVCYEIFVRSFADSDGDGIGDLQGVIDRLDHVNDGDPSTSDDLGANCIWFMPIAEATSYHGYDTVDYSTIEQDYGSNDTFLALMSAARDRGIRVIIDLVINHVSVDHPWFQQALADPNSPYRDYFIFEPTDPDYAGSFGQQVWFPAPSGDAYYYATFGEGLPDLDYRNPAVTEAAHDIARFWLDEMGVDGFRLDAIKHLIEIGTEQENTEETHLWLRDFGAFLTSVKPDVYAIGEIFNASAFMLSDYFPDQLTAYFQFEISAQIIQAVQVQTAGSLTYSIEDGLEQAPDQRFAPFLTNHDQIRTMSLLSGNVAQAKLAATTLLTLPGLPFIYYGEEIGMTGNKPDPQLRTPMQWTADASGFTTGTPWIAPQGDAASVNVAAQTDDPDSLLSHYRALVRLHLDNPALVHGETIVLDAPSSVAAYVRQSAAGQAVLVVINFDDEPVAAPELGGEFENLAPNTYTLAPLMGDATADPVTVAADGAIVEYTGIAELAPETGYVFELREGA